MESLRRFQANRQVCPTVMEANRALTIGEAVFISPTMLRRFAKWGVVAALMLTLGFHWAFLQSVAWVGMVVNYSQDGSVQQALVKTFDGQHLCPLCKMVKAGKSSESKQDLKLDLKKLDMFADASAEFYFPPVPVQCFEFHSHSSSHLSVSLAPPPRSLLG